MKELQITVKSNDEKAFKQAVDYALYEISLGVKDNDIDIVIEDGSTVRLIYRLFEDL